MKIYSNTIHKLSKKDWIICAAITAALTASAATNSSTNHCPPLSPAFNRACDVTKQRDYAPGDRIVNASFVQFKTLTPLISSDVYSNRVQGYVLESLITRDPDTLDWQGLIAKSWQISPDGLTFIFQLRQDVRFSDGVPLTAEDVAFTFDLIMNKAVDAPRERAYEEKIKTVKANGKYEAVFTFKAPYFKALEVAGGMSILPKHFYQAYLQKPEEFNHSKGMLMGSGPYRLRNPQLGWMPSDDNGNVVLVRNDNYWGDVQPPFDRIMWRVSQDANARLILYRNGEVDTYGPRPMEYSTLQANQLIRNKSYDFAAMPPAAPYRYIGWNEIRDGKSTRFADKRVRQAMSYLADVNRIVKDIYLGQGEPAVGPFGNASKQHNANLRPYLYDAAKALTLLKAAGYTNHDGVLADQYGNSFEFTLNYRANNEDFERIALLLKDSYAKVGISMHLVPKEWGVLLESLKKKNFDAVMIGWSGDIESDLYQIFHSSQALHDGDNAVSYANPQLDALVEKADITIDENARMPLWQQAERLIYEDQPYTFLVYEKELVFIDKRFSNLKVTQRSGLNWGMVPIESFVPISQQRYVP